MIDKEIKFAFIIWGMIWVDLFMVGFPQLALIVFYGGLAILYWANSLFYDRDNRRYRGDDTQAT